MDQKLPPTVGVVACLLVVAVVGGPFLVLPGQESSALPEYYAAGLGGAWVVGLLGLVGLIAFAGGRQRRTDPDTVAGATVVVGVVMVALALEWALSVDVELLQSITTAAWMTHHRWAVVGLSVPVPVVAGWYARVIGVL